VVENSFETLLEEWLGAWLRAKKKGKKAGHAGGVSQFPSTRLRSCGRKQRCLERSRDADH
jgi:hypothetical protein